MTRDHPINRSESRSAKEKQSSRKARETSNKSFKRAGNTVFTTEVKAEMSIFEVSVNFNLKMGGGSVLIVLIVCKLKYHENYENICVLKRHHFF